MTTSELPTEGMYHYLLTKQERSALEELFVRAEELGRLDEERRALLGLRTLFEAGQLEKLIAVLRDDEGQSTALRMVQVNLVGPHGFTKTALVIMLKRVPPHICARFHAQD